ncbi:hypothetical protein DL96DRAFT_145482 [Flagelloscypha sp. PMI_526]|nr:hypothetical protein DL96DRAFT_145482 [Flagelloscypha sp. PMI_526]
MLPSYTPSFKTPKILMRNSPTPYTAPDSWNKLSLFMRCRPRPRPDLLENILGQCELANAIHSLCPTNPAVSLSGLRLSGKFLPLAGQRFGRFAHTPQLLPVELSERHILSTIRPRRHRFDTNSYTSPLVGVFIVASSTALARIFHPPVNKDPRRTTRGLFLMDGSIGVDSPGHQTKHSTLTPPPSIIVIHRSRSLP